MKKYLYALIPLGFCWLLGFATSRVSPTDYPDPTYPFRTPEVLYYLSGNWFIIGIVLWGVFICLIAIGDLFSKAEKRLEHRRIDSYLKKHRDS
jgi:hypothetical protein